MKVFPHYDLSPFASDDPRRPAINAVHFRPERVEATDGRILAWIGAPQDAPFPEVSLSAPEFGKACKLLRKPGELGLPTVPGSPATLEVPGAVAHLPLAFGEFPNTSPVVPPMGEGRHTVCLGVPVLARLVAYLKKHGAPVSSKVGPVVTLHLPPDSNNPILWEASVCSGVERDTVRGVLMPCARH